MEFVESLNSSLVINIFEIIIAVCIVLVFIRTLMVKKIKAANRAALKERFPDLSTKDLKYRRTNINNYYHAYAQDPWNNITIIFTLIILVTIGVIIGTLISDNLVSTYVAMAIFSLSISIVLLFTPKYEKQVDFWSNYLDEHPDNPLMVLLMPSKDYRKIIVISKITGIAYFCLGFYMLFLAYIIFTLNL